MTDPKIRTQVSRNTDHENSHQGEMFINESGSRDKIGSLVARYVRKYPGLTRRELTKKMKLDRSLDENIRFWLDAEAVQKRASDQNGVTIKKGKSRKCSVSNRMAATWIPLQEVK